MNQNINTSNMEEIIKTTAKIQDTDKPLIQTPLRASQRGPGVEFQGGNNNNSSLTTEIMSKQKADSGTELLSGNQKDYDNGVDNPFRPGSDICREAQPIVDFYKSGLNHSRAQSPVFPGSQAGFDKNNDGKLLDNGLYNDSKHNGTANSKKKTCCKCSKCWPCCTIS